MSLKFTPIANCESENICVPSPPKSLTSRDGSATYLRMYYKHNTGTVEHPDYKDPKYELNIAYGTIRRKMNNGREEWKLNITVTDNDDLKGLSNLDLGRARCFEQHKGALKLPNFNSQNP